MIDATKSIGAGLLACALTTASILHAGAASAQSASDKARAEALFQQGRELFEKGVVDEACRRFEESQKIEQKLGTLLNLAVCHEKQGRTASAWAEFTEAANIADRRGETERAKFARDQAAALSPKLAHITVRVDTEIAGLTILFDGQSFGGAGAKLPIDPGPHRVEARAPGHKTWSTEVQVPPGPSTMVVQIPRLEPEAPAQPVEKPPVTEPPPAEPPTQPPPQRQPSDTSGGEVHPAAWVLFGIGGASLLAGAITGGVSLGMAGDLKERCQGGVCGPDDADDLSKANTLANVSNVTLAIGGAGTVAGLVVALVSVNAGAEPREVSVIGVGDAGAGISVGF